MGSVTELTARGTDGADDVVHDRDADPARVNRLGRPRAGRAGHGDAPAGRTDRGADASAVAVEMTLIARRGRVRAGGRPCTCELDVTTDETLHALLERLACHHGFAAGTPATLHVDPQPGDDPTRWHPTSTRSIRYRFGDPDDPVSDGRRRAVDVLPPGATGYLCVGAGQWLWYLRSLQR